MCGEVGSGGGSLFVVCVRVGRGRGGGEVCTMTVVEGVVSLLGGWGVC